MSKSYEYWWFPALLDMSNPESPCSMPSVHAPGLSGIWCGQVSSFIFVLQLPIPSLWPFPMKLCVSLIFSAYEVGNFCFSATFFFLFYFVFMKMSHIIFTEMACQPRESFWSMERGKMPRLKYRPRGNSYRTRTSQQPLSFSASKSQMLRKVLNARGG